MEIYKLIPNFLRTFLMVMQVAITGVLFAVPMVMAFFITSSPSPLFLTRRASPTVGRTTCGEIVALLASSFPSLA